MRRLNPVYVNDIGLVLAKQLYQKTHLNLMF